MSEKRLPPLLRRSWFNLNKAFRRRISHLNLTPDQFTALRWISEHRDDCIIQRELVDLMASDPNTVVSILNRLEKMDFIERQPSPNDKRVYHLKITPSGQEILDEALPIALSLQQEILKEITPEQLEEFTKTLNLIVNATGNLQNNDKTQ
jgi:DNA-binding MarR family transcriptional regulator